MKTGNIYQEHKKRKLEKQKSDAEAIAQFSDQKKRESSFKNSKDRSATQLKKTPKMTVDDLDDIYNLEDKETSMDKTPPKTPSSKKKSDDIARKKTGPPPQRNASRRSWLQEKWVENTYEKDSFEEFSVSKPQGETDILNEAENFMTKK